MRIYVSIVEVVYKSCIAIVFTVSQLMFNYVPIKNSLLLNVSQKVLCVRKIG